MSNEHNHNMDTQKPENTETETKKEETSENLTISTAHNQSNPSESNNGVVIKNTESQSLNSLCAYDTGSDSESSLPETKKTGQNWRNKDDSDSEDSSEDSSSSSSSSTSSSSDSDDDEVTGSSSEDEEETTVAPSQSKGAVKKNSAVSNSGLEWEYEHLPPVPDLSKLSITTENEIFIHMGNVVAIINVLVTIEALPNTPVYDLDTVLFLDNGKKTMGLIYDVFGPVTSPMYAVRFNTAEDIKNLGIEVNTKVYSAPNNQHTQYVFLQQLLKLKGSDASWVGDTEVPQEFADYSDDENECLQRYGNKKLTPHMKRPHSTENFKKHQSMVNRNNALNTELNQSMGSPKPNRRHKAVPRRSQAPQMNRLMPMFDPSVPPPNYGHHMSLHHQPGPGVQMMPNYPVAPTPGTAAANFSSGASLSTQTYPMNNFVYNFPQTNQTGPVQVIPNYSVTPGTAAGSGESQFQSSSVNNSDPNLGQTNFANYFVNHRGPSQN